MKKQYLVLLFILYISCQQEEPKTSSLLTYIPNNAAVVIKINDFDVLKSDLKNNSFLKGFQKTEQYIQIIKNLKPLENLKISDKCVLSFTEVGKEQFEFLLKINADQKSLEVSNIKNKIIEEFTYENSSYQKISMDSLPAVYSYTLAPNTFISSSQLLIENLIRTEESQKIDDNLLKLFSASSNTRSAVVFINTENADGILNSCVAQENSFKISEFCKWISLDAEIEQNQIKFSGISTANQPTKFASIFNNISALTNNTPRFAPLASKAILSYTFENYQDFHKNQQEYLEIQPKKDTVFNAVFELGIVDLNAKKIVMLQTYGAENIIKYLEGKSTITTTYQGNEIVTLTDKNVLNTFKALVPTFESNYYTILENTFVFSEDVESLQNCISSFKNEATFDKSETYVTIKNTIADESNILFIATPEGLDSFIKEDFKKNIAGNLKNLDVSKQCLAIQVVSDNNFFHTSLILKKIASKITLNMTAPLFTVRLDSDMATQPQFVRNHRTNKKEIVVQDQDNTLYLIDTDGKVLWKKAIEGRILGKIEQVDLYKNGRLQLAFATPTKFIILDYNGEIVPPFNKTFGDIPLSGLAIFDYDNNRDYRFLLVQDKKMTMLNNKAEQVQGFNFKEVKSKITKTPKHFRINEKDYIVFPEENGALTILNRVGDQRILVKEKINFSQNEIFNYKNTFTTTDERGVLFQIDEKGNSSTTQLSLNKDHGLQASGTILVSMNDNVLTIKEKITELELGVYTNPQIFTINNKIYVSVTDLQNQKIYLFDSNADPIQNFPVYGTSAIDLADMDNDKKLELVAKDLENSLIVYKIN